MTVQNIDNNGRASNTTLTMLVDSGASGNYLVINICPMLKDFMEDYITAKNHVLKGTVTGEFYKAAPSTRRGLFTR